MRTCILGRQSLSDNLLPSRRSSGCFLETQEPGTCTQVGRLSAGQVWHDFPNLLSVKEDAISVNTQGKLRDPYSGPNKSHSCFKGLTVQSVSAAPVPARVQVAIATKACGQQPTCISGNLDRVGEGTSKHSSAQALMAVGLPPES